MNKFQTHAGRMFLAAIGILVTSTAGHAAARIMSAQISLSSPGFAFQLALMISALLISACIAAYYCSQPLRLLAESREFSKGRDRS